MNKFHGGAEDRRVTKCRCSVLSINWYLLVGSAEVCHKMWQPLHAGGVFNRSTLKIVYG
jgi:hypothetical protein